jgi:hypothetical protein
MLVQTIAIAALIILAYTVFFAITVTAFASLPPDMTGLAVPLGIVAACVVLAGTFLGAGL